LALQIRPAILRYTYTELVETLGTMNENHNT